MDLSNLFLGLTGLSLLGWLYLLTGRSGFWRARPRIEDERSAAPAVWPAVVAIMPARNEAEHVGKTLRSLLDQEYAGRLGIVLIDDGSEDGTRAIAERLKGKALGAGRLEVIAARPLPPGWTGKLWAMAEGLAHAGQIAPDAALSAAYRCRHRPRPGRARPARGQGRGRAARSRLAHGAASVRVGTGSAC